jgi:hypothetical protein
MPVATSMTATWSGSSVIRSGSPPPVEHRAGGVGERFHGHRRRARDAVAAAEEARRSVS